jgi:DNA-binding transcriptional regulator LsrR (DeoR family)
VETVDRVEPETKAELAQEVGISQQYLSELLQELKATGVIQKSYVVDNEALYDASEAISKLYDTANGADDRGTSVSKLLDRLESVTTRQYEAARAAFLAEDVDRSAGTLEPVTNRSP